MQIINEPGQIIEWNGKLCEVVGIGEGKTIHFKPVREKDKAKCENCGQILEEEISLLEHSPLFQEGVIIYKKVAPSK